MSFQDGRVLRTIGRLAAPWFHAGGRALKSKQLARWAVDADPNNLGFAQTAGAGDSAAVVARLRAATLLAMQCNAADADVIMELLAKSESQLLQDVFCLLTLGQKRGGYFVEVGVGAGRRISNTYLLEQGFGWSGLLVEPNRSFHPSILEDRSAFLEKRAAAAASGLHLTFHEHKDGERSRLAGGDSAAPPPADVSAYQVETVRLDDLFKERAAPPHIDFLSIDTEGSELAVMHGIDWRQYRFGVLAIEHNFNVAALRAYRDLLGPLGYRQVLPHVTSFDAWFVAEELAAKWRS
jgi:FkbM family methyltransferase